MTSFNPFADSLEVRFTCPHCNNETYYMVLRIPSPNWAGDTAASSENYDDVDLYCEHCGHSFTMDIFVNIMDGEIVITDDTTHQEVTKVSIKDHYIEEDESVVASVMNT